MNLSISVVFLLINQINPDPNTGRIRNPNEIEVVFDKQLSN